MDVSQTAHADLHIFDLSEKTIAIATFADCISDDFLAIVPLRHLTCTIGSFSLVFISRSLFDGTDCDPVVYSHLRLRPIHCGHLHHFACASQRHHDDHGGV